MEIECASLGLVLQENDKNNPVQEGHHLHHKAIITLTVNCSIVPVVTNPMASCDGIGTSQEFLPNNAGRLIKSEIQQERRYSDGNRTTTSSPILSSRDAQKVTSRTQSARPYMISRPRMLSTRSLSCDTYLGLVTANFSMDLELAYKNNGVKPYGILVCKENTEVISNDLKTRKRIAFQRVPSMLLPKARTRLNSDIVDKVRNSSRIGVVPLDIHSTLELSTYSGLTNNHVNLRYDSEMRTPPPSFDSCRRLSASMSSLSSVSSCDTQQHKPIQTKNQPIQNGEYLDTFANTSSVILMMNKLKARASSKKTSTTTEEDPTTAENQLASIECPECRKLIQNRGHKDQYVRDWWDIVVSTSRHS